MVNNVENILTIRNKGKYLFNCVISILVFGYVFIANRYYLTIPGIAFAIIALLFFCVIPMKQVFFITGICFMLETWIPFSYIVLVGAVACIIKRGITKKNQSSMVLICLFVCLQVFSTVFEGLDIFILLKVGICLIAEVFFFSSIRSEEEATSFSMGIAIGFVVLAISTLIIALRSVSLSQIIVNFRLGSTTLERWLPDGAIIPNENNMARYAVFAITVSLLLKNKCKIGKLAFLIYNIFAIIIVLLTQSRSGLFLLGLSYIFFYLGSNKKRKVIDKIKVVGSIVVVLTILYFLISRFMPEIIKVIETRFHDEDLTNGRLDNFVFYHEQWVSNIRWILVGFGDQRVNLRFAHYHNVHSAIQAYFVHYGILGAVVFFGFFGSFIHGFAQKIEKSRVWIAWLPLIIVGIGKLFGAMNTTELLVSATVSMMYVKQSSRVIGNTVKDN